MFKRVLLGVSTAAALGLMMAPTASAADGDVFRTLHECNGQAIADVQAAGGPTKLRAWCEEIHVVGPPVLGCTNPIENGGCIGDFWQEHTRPV